MRILATLAVVLVTVAASAGCAHEVGGTALRGAPAGFDDYGWQLKDPDQQTQILSEAIRRADPCALLDEGVLTQFGAVIAYGRNGGIGNCRAKFKSPGNTRNGYSTVTVGLDGPQNVGSRAGDIDGAAFFYNGGINDSSGGCNRYVALEITAPGLTNPPHPRHLAINASSGLVDPCIVVEAVAHRAVATMRAGIPNQDPRTTPVPLSIVDPCALMGDLPEGVEVTGWRVDTDPYECVFDLSTGYGDAIYVAYHTFSGEARVSAGEKGRIVAIGGHEFATEDSFPGESFLRYRAGPAIGVSRGRPDTLYTMHTEVWLSLPTELIERVAAKVPKVYGEPR